MIKPAVIILEDSSKAGFGGGQQITLHVIDSLKNNFELYIFDTGKETSFNKSLLKIQNLNRLKYHTALPNIGSIGFLNLLAEILLMPWQVILNSIKIIKLCYRIKIKQQNFLIYSTTKKTLFFAFTISLFVKGSKYIHHLHSYENTRLIGFKIKKIIYQKAKALISVSDFIFNSFPLKKNHLIYNPVLANKHVSIKDIINQNAIKIVTFSSLIPAKGVEYFMKAYNYLPETLKEKVFFDIYGEGILKNKLKQFESNHVRLKGFCNNINEILIHDAHITVLSSIIPESFGMQIIESFACGVPVIATNIGAQGQLVKNGVNGMLVSIKNPMDIAEKIKLILEDSNLYRHLAQQALLDSKMYDMLEFKKSINNLFTKVLNE